MVNNKIFLININDIPCGHSQGFLPDKSGKDTVFLIKSFEGTYGYKNICPHYGDTSLPWKKDAFLNGDKSKIVCAAHGALFNIATGECIQGPCLGQSLQPITLTITDSGNVYYHV